MARSAAPGDRLDWRALNRATLARQSLLERSTMPVEQMLERLVGMQAQTPHTAYVGLWSRIEGFRAQELSDRLVDRSVVRMALMRSTIHLVTARDAWDLRRLLQPVLDRMQRGQFGRRLEGVDTDAVVAMGRAFVDERPRSFKELGDHLLTRWPDRERMALEQAVRTGVPLVQVPPRGLWGRSGPIAHTSIEAWLGQPPPEGADPRRPGQALPRGVRAGQRHGRPGVVWPHAPRRGGRPAAAEPCHLPRRDRARAVRSPGRPASRSRHARAAAVPVRLREPAAVVRRPLADGRSRGCPRHHPGDAGADQHVHDRRFRRRDVADRADRHRRGKAGTSATLVIKPVVRIAPEAAAALAEEGAGLLAFATDGATDVDVRFQARDDR